MFVDERDQIFAIIVGTARKLVFDFVVIVRKADRKGKGEESNHGRRGDGSENAEIGKERKGNGTREIKTKTRKERRGNENRKQMTLASAAARHSPSN